MPFLKIIKIYVVSFPKLSKTVDPWCRQDAVVLTVDTTRLPFGLSTPRTGSIPFRDHLGTGDSDNVIAHT
jgi:hypothetical protein